MGPADRARATIDARTEELVELSHRIHAHPELKFEERRAAAWCAELLAGAGLTVEEGICGLPTAFAARAGSGPLGLAICAEYDALPGMGHACGHNIIAAAAVGAGLALAPLADELGITVTVLGTPAEEGGGGKVLMLERGAFDGVNAALMVHPAPHDGLRPRVSAVAHFEVTYTGRESHAAAAPQLGVNAADAFVVAQTAVGLLRQHLRPTDQVHGVVLHGGETANIVPAHTRGNWMVRARTIEELDEVRERVERCFQAGALATGCELMTRDLSSAYTEMLHDGPLLDAFRTHAEALGRKFQPGREMTFSTDMGNISLEIPSIHPCLGIDSDEAVNHQPEFAAACVNESADRAVRDGALLLALTAIDAASGSLREHLLTRV